VSCHLIRTGLYLMVHARRHDRLPLHVGMVPNVSTRLSFTSTGVSNVCTRRINVRQLHFPHQWRVLVRSHKTSQQHFTGCEPGGQRRFTSCTTWEGKQTLVRRAIGRCAQQRPDGAESLLGGFPIDWGEARALLMLTSPFSGDAVV